MTLDPRYFHEPAPSCRGCRERDDALAAQRRDSEDMLGWINRMIAVVIMLGCAAVTLAFFVGRGTR